MLASSLKLQPGGDLVSNYKPVTKTEMLVPVFAVGLVWFKNPFKGILHLVQNSSEMRAGCAFGISPRKESWVFECVCGRF